MRYLRKSIRQDIARRAEAERNAGGSIKICPILPTVSIELSDGTEYFCQEEDATRLLSEVPPNVSAEDYILASAQSW